LNGIIWQGYNCAAIAIDRVRAFDEAMNVLLCGTGLGFSVERRMVEKLPTIAEEFHKTDTTIHVADSKIGWSKAFRELLSLLYVGQIPKWDLSKVRPEGTPLKVFGGRASGPLPLQELFQFCAELFESAKGRKLSSLEAHDIMCKMGSSIIVGGVRRVALISLSNLTDERMRMAKSGQWWIENPQRALANNSVAYTEKPDIGIFMKEWLSLYESKSGERGIVNRAALEKKVLENGRREGGHTWLLNPCGEVILRDRETCNLTEVIVRDYDTEESISEKVRVASILGTFQSTLTNFRYVSSEWKKNCEEERLLGVSLTGIMDSKLTNGVKSGLEGRLTKWKNIVIDTNKKYAKSLGINQSVSCTVCKPSGTVSALVDSSSGIHARHSEYYIRTVRSDNKDPICKFMQDQGIPNEPELHNPRNMVVFSFPTKSPKHAVFRNDKTAIEQLELWKTYKTYWTEHNPSVTITVKEHEWIEVGAWVYKNFDDIGGVSFLPYTDHSYRQAPYQEITKEEYDEWMKTFPKSIDWDKLSDYEKEDNTTGSQEMACSGDKGCELVDIT
jgi:ribonucleoside-triphosphate reductase (thioredoxin)